MQPGCRLKAAILSSPNQSAYRAGCRGNTQRGPFENGPQTDAAAIGLRDTNALIVLRYGQYTVPGYSDDVVAADPFAMWQDDGADTIGWLVVATADQPVIVAVVMLYVSLSDGM